MNCQVGCRISNSEFNIQNSEFENGCVVAEAFLAQLFHKFDGDQGDAILSRVTFDALLHHGTQEIGNATQAELRVVIPRDVRFLRRVEGNLYFLAALRGIETPLIFVSQSP